VLGGFYKKINYIKSKAEGKDITRQIGGGQPPIRLIAGFSPSHRAFGDAVSEQDLSSLLTSVAR
jgi:hypothetical protein